MKIWKGIRMYVMGYEEKKDEESYREDDCIVEDIRWSEKKDYSG